MKSDDLYCSRGISWAFHCSFICSSSLSFRDNWGFCRFVPYSRSILFVLCWPLVTSILTRVRNDGYSFELMFNELLNAFYFSSTSIRSRARQGVFTPPPSRSCTRGAEHRPGVECKIIFYVVMFVIYSAPVNPHANIENNLWLTIGQTYGEKLIPTNHSLFSHDRFSIICFFFY